MSDIIVTGGNGFLGRALLSALVEQGHRPRALVRRPEMMSRLNAVYHDAVDCVVVDFEHSSSIAGALGAHPIGTLFHLAGGRAAHGSGALRNNVASNVSTTVELLEALTNRSSPVDTFILASTGEVYGPQPGPFHEDLMARPATSYASAKLAAEVLALGNPEMGRSTIVARLGVVYGPRDDTHDSASSASRMLLPQLMASALKGDRFDMSSGEQTRDFLYVEDAARALIQLGGVKAAHGKIVNVGAGKSYPVREVADLLLEKLGRPIRLELGALPQSPNEILDYQLDITQLVTLTGFLPRWSLADGITEMARRR